MSASPLDRVILHADMDAFYAAVEQRDDPSLRGRPVVVGGDGRRGVVSTASYEARRSGVRSAMPGRQARRLCPDAVFLPVRMARYLEVSRRVRAVFERFTPLVEPLSLDEAFLDVTGSRALFGSGAAIAARLRDEVRDATGGLTVSVGVATSKFVAKVASDLDKPDGMVVVPPGGEQEFLAPLPVSRLWGAGPVAQQRLRALGLSTIGDLRRTAPELLAVRLGARAAQHFHALARGVDPRPVVADREAKSIGRERTFEVDVRDAEVLDAALRAMVEDVGRRLRDAARRAGTLRLKLRYPPFETRGRQRRLRPPVDDDPGLLRVARELLGEVRASRRPVRLLGISASDLQESDQGLPRQGALFDTRSPEESARAADAARQARVDRAIDTLRDRFGRDVIRRGG